MLKCLSFTSDCAFTSLEVAGTLNLDLTDTSVTPKVLNLDLAGPVFFSNGILLNMTSYIYLLSFENFFCSNEMGQFFIGFVT